MTQTLGTSPSGAADALGRFGAADASGSANTVEWRSPAAWGITPWGLPWFGSNGGAWTRQPVVPVAALPERLTTLVSCPSGARLCFRTDAEAVFLRLSYQAGEPAPPRNIPISGSRGVEIWVGGAFWALAIPADATAALDTPIFRAVPRPAADPQAPTPWREFCLYLPYFAPVADIALGFPAEARVVPVEPPPSLPLVFYGSSITHGACASRPALTYSARVARALGHDFVNLGMSNSAPVELARLVADVPAAAYVLELGTNFYGSPALFPSACGAFLDVLRGRRPATPVIAFGPMICGPAVGLTKRGLNQTAGFDAVRVALRGIVRRRRAADARFSFVDGLDLLGEAEVDGLADDMHPNDHGHALMAQRLTPLIRMALGPA